MPRHDVVVIGASAGGLQALKQLFEGLPATFPAAVLIVVHVRSNGTGALPEILARAGRLPVEFAADGDAIVPGRVYVAHADRHLLITDDGLRVVHGPRENGFRPAIDPLFRTAARIYGSRVVGIILSGALSDGVYGLSVIKEHGGVAVVQHPADAIVPTMPRNAMSVVDADHVVPVSEMAALLERLTASHAEGARRMAAAKDPRRLVRHQRHEPASVEAEISVGEGRAVPKAALRSARAGRSTARRNGPKKSATNAARSKPRKR